jgi:hypothetical protein
MADVYNAGVRVMGQDPTMFSFDATDAIFQPQRPCADVVAELQTQRHTVRDLEHAIVRMVQERAQVNAQDGA